MTGSRRTVAKCCISRPSATYPKFPIGIAFKTILYVSAMYHVVSTVMEDKMADGFDWRRVAVASRPEPEVTSCE